MPDCEALDRTPTGGMEHEGHGTKFSLGNAQGQGVLQDHIQAHHMWYNLSAGEKRSAEARDALAQRMTPAQVPNSAHANEWASLVLHEALHRTATGGGGERSCSTSGLSASRRHASFYLHTVILCSTQIIFAHQTGR